MSDSLAEEDSFATPMKNTCMATTPPPSAAKVALQLEVRGLELYIYIYISYDKSLIKPGHTEAYGASGCSSASSRASSSTQVNINIYYKLNK